MQICEICHPHPCCHVGQTQWDWNEHSTTVHYSTWVLWASEPASLGKIRYWWKQGCNIMIVTIYWNFLCSRHCVKIFVVVISQWLCNVNMLKKKQYRSRLYQSGCPERKRAAEPVGRMEIHTHTHTTDLSQGIKGVCVCVGIRVCVCVCIIYIGTHTGAYIMDEYTCNRCVYIHTHILF